MGLLSVLPRVIFPDYFRAPCAQKCSQGTMALRLWRTGLLFCFIHVCLCLGRTTLYLLYWTHKVHISCVFMCFPLHVRGGVRPRRGWSAGVAALLLPGSPYFCQLLHRVENGRGSYAQGSIPGEQTRGGTGCKRRLDLRRCAAHRQLFSDGARSWVQSA